MKIEIPTELFINLMDKVSNSTSLDSQRWLLKKVLIEIDENNIKMIACDGYKLSMAAAKHNNKDCSAMSLLIDPIPLILLKGSHLIIISRDNENCYIIAKGQYEIKLTFFQPAESYLDYNKVLRSNAYSEAFEISFDAQKMIKILRSYKGRNNHVKLRFALDQYGKPSNAKPIYLTDDSTDIHISNILLPIRE